MSTPILAQGVGERRALLVDQRAHLVDHQASACGGRTKKAPSKPRALFIRPIDERQRDRRPTALEHAQRFEGGEDAQGAIEPPAVWNRVEVAADQNGAV